MQRKHAPIPKKNLAKKFASSTPKKALQFVESADVVLPASPMCDYVPEDGFQTPIQQPKDPTHEQLVATPRNVGTRDVAPGTPPPVDEAQKKYPKRGNAKPPERYGYANH